MVTCQRRGGSLPSAHRHRRARRPPSYRQHRFRRPPGATELLLVRHGESAPAVHGSRSPSSTGTATRRWRPRARSRRNGSPTASPTRTIDAIYVTTLRRTHETAAPLAARLGIDARRRARPPRGPPRRVGGRAVPPAHRRGPPARAEDVRASSAGTSSPAPSQPTTPSARPRRHRPHRRRPSRRAGRRRQPRRRDRRDHRARPSRRPRAFAFIGLRQRVDLPPRRPRRPLDPAPVQRHRRTSTTTSTSPRSPPPLES